jgi:hypothetical protein
MFFARPLEASRDRKRRLGFIKEALELGETALSRGGDRQANNAIHTIALSRAKHDPATRIYLERRISEGKTCREAMRCLKRQLSHVIYERLITIDLTS